MSSAWAWAAWFWLSSTGGRPNSCLSLFIRSSACCTSSSRGTDLGSGLCGCKIVIAGLLSRFKSSDSIVLDSSAGATSSTTVATTAIVTPAPSAILTPELLLGGTAGGCSTANEFAMPQRGQEDLSDPYLLPHTEQSTHESIVPYLPLSFCLVNMPCSIKYILCTMPLGHTQPF